MSLDEQFAQLLPSAMMEAVEEFPAPSPDLVSRATARGMRQVKVRVVQMSAAALALAVVATGGALFGVGALSGGDGGASPTHTVAGGPVVPGQDANVPYHKAGPPVTASWMAATLTGLLPKSGQVTHTGGLGMMQKWGVLRARADYTTPTGTSGLSLSVSRHNTRFSAGQYIGYSGCLAEQKSTMLGAKCTPTTLRDGSVLTVTESVPARGIVPQGLYSVDLITKDGLEILIMEEAGGTGGKSTRPSDLVLSPDQLTAIISSPVWTKAFDALPTPPLRPGHTGSTPTHGLASGAEVRDVITSALSKDGKLTDWGVSDGYAVATYDKGADKGVISVQTQSGMYKDVSPLMACERGETVCTAGTTGDGAKVKVHMDYSWDPGAPESVVDVLYPDGRRIIATWATDRYGVEGAVTQDNPGISLDELKSIALNSHLQGGK